MNGRFDIPMEWYAVFCAVAKAGSITQAAENLCVSQPAVSVTIKQLEERLGHPLLVRSARGVALTPEGSVLYSYLEKAMGLIEAAERKYLEMTRLEAGSISIGAGDTLCSQYLLTYLEEYNRRYPGVNIKVTNRTSAETLDILRTGEVDLGFVNMPVELDDNMEFRQCMAVQDCLIGGGKFAELAQWGLPLQELKEYPLLMLETASASRRFIDRYALDHGTALRPVLELGSNDLLIKFARINLGLAFVIREFAQEVIDGETLFEIPLSPPPPPRAIGMVRHRTIPPSYAASAFINMIFQ